MTRAQKARWLARKLAGERGYCPECDTKGVPTMADGKRWVCGVLACPVLAFTREGRVVIRWPA